MGFFDRFMGERPPLVRRGTEDVLEMLRRGHEMFAAATAFVLDNEILDVDLKAIDRGINEGERDLRRAVLEHLTIEPDRELIFSLKLLSIVAEAERIGDIGKTLAKVGKVAKKPRMGPLVEPLRDIRDRVLQMFDTVQAGFVDADEQAARDVMKIHEEMKDDVTAYINDLAARDDITANEGIVFALSARLMSRVSSHLANIASTVASPFDQIRRSTTWSAEGKK